VEEFFTRFFENLGLKTEGPMRFRFILQPLVSLILALKAGLRDSKKRQVPYFWGLVFYKGERKELVREGWNDLSKLFIVAIILDVIVQLIILKTVYPMEAILTAVLLALIPYIFFRGIFNRLFLIFKKTNDGNND
jgi:hypothetical protein